MYIYENSVPFIKNANTVRGAFVCDYNLSTSCLRVKKTNLIVELRYKCSDESITGTKMLPLALNGSSN